MKNILVPLDGISKKAFTLVELLVVITILAILGIAAYTGYSGVKGKAYITRKISDIASISKGLITYKINKNYYPPLDMYSVNNLWGYSGTTIAQPSNTIKVQKQDNVIESIIVAKTKGGGKVYGTGSNIAVQIGGKGTISQKTLGSKFLSEDLFDPELGNIKLNNGVFKDKGIGRYVYAIYKKNFNNTKGTYYNLAYTVINKDEEYVSMISGDYDENVCRIKTNCPKTLIGSGTVIISKNQKQKITTNTLNINQGIPYPITDFSQ